MKNSRQVGIIKEVKGKKAIIQVGVLPIIVNIDDLLLVKEKEQEQG
jgi:DNA mismatch repair protein MutS2